jgi:predicted negative regulator of RcsB-dependent stress response
MIEVYDSHEQSERVKRWLKENGGSMLLGLALAFGSLFGFKQWQLWNQSKHQQASAEYQLMVDLLDEGNLDAAVANYETLKDKYPGSAYTPFAALHMAKARLEAGQAELAVQLLEAAMQKARPEPVRIVARERLARVRLDQGEPQAALDLLDEAPVTAGFEAQFAEIRGDVYRRMGDIPAALRHYEEALELMETGVGNRSFLEIKIESLGGSAQPEGETSW